MSIALSLILKSADTGFNPGLIGNFLVDISCQCLCVGFEQVMAVMCCDCGLTDKTCSIAHFPLILTVYHDSEQHLTMMVIFQAHMVMDTCTCQSG